MEAILFKQPYEVSFTGNPMPFVFSINPYGSIERTMDIRLAVRVMVELSYNSNNFSEIRSQTFYPDATGIITVDVSNILHPYLTYYTPNLNLSVPVECVGQRVRYKINYLLFVNNQVIGSTQESSVLNAIKGGMSFEEWNPKSFFTDFIAAQKNALFFTSKNQCIAPDEYHWLFWTNPLPSIGLQVVEIGITYNDLGTQVIVLPNAVKLNKWGVGCAPFGIKQLLPNPSLNRFITKYTVCVKQYPLAPPPTLTINIADYEGMRLKGSADAQYVVLNGKKYLLSAADIAARGSETFTLVDDSALLQIPSGDAAPALPNDNNFTYVVAPISFQVDYRNFYRTHQLFYRSSIGGLNTLRLKAHVDMEADYARQQAIRVLPPDYYENTLLIAQQVEQSIFETLKFSGSTGFMNREEAAQLRDIFLSKERWELQDGKMVPIVLSSKNVKFFSNRDNLIAIQLEWNRAYLNQFYTPKSLLPLANTCPALDAFYVRQINATTLQISYSAPLPYDKVQIQLIINNKTTVLTFAGSTKTLRQTIAQMPDGTVITVIGKVICNANTTPMDVGPASVVNLTLHGASDLVANDDTFYIPTGYTTDTVLQNSVLANDYDPDGQNIEVVPAAGNTHGDGINPGTYSINAQGIVTYKPPTANFFGRDYFNYTIVDASHSRSATAMCFIVVGNGPAGVFAKLVTRNSYNNGDAYNPTVYGEVWIDFFSDAAATQVLDVTTLNLTINYQYTEIYHYDNQNPQDSQTVTPASIAATGTKVKIYEGVLDQMNFIDWLAGTYNSYTINFKLQGGSGYYPL